MDLKPHAIRHTPLPRLLKKHGIAGQNELRRFIESVSEGVETEEPCLHVMHAADMDLDGESRLYDEVIRFQNRILDVDMLRLENSSRVELVSCILCGDLTVSQKELKTTDVYLDGCIILGHVVLSGLPDTKGFIFQDVNCISLEISQCKLNTIHINGSEIGLFSVRDSEVGYLYAQGNTFHSLSVDTSPIRDIDFDHRQVDPDWPNVSAELIDSWRDHPPFNLFRRRPYDFSESEVAEASDTRFQTLSFLRSRTALRGDVDSLAKIKAFEVNHYQNTRNGQVLMQLLGAFVRPGRILVLWAILFTICAAFYASPTATFRTSQSTKAVHLSGTDSMYFSGVTIATIGYGDIAPLGLTKAVAVLEGLGGMILASCFLVSLMRRYVEA